MRNIHRVTNALAAFVLVTAILAITTGSRSQNPSAVVAVQENTGAAFQKIEARRRTFPTVDYDEAEPSNPSKQEKRKRYNKFGLVAREAPTGVEISFMGGPYDDLPALPVEKSDVIIMGDVTAGEAHLSEDKQNVFSEFIFRVSKVYKATTSPIPAVDSSIVVERVGGYVRYPNGHRVLYRGAGLGMPPVGRTCVLFLNPIPQSDAYRILTGYELGVKGVESLDYANDEAFRGMDVSTFLGTLVDLVTKASAP